jgi:hypothetical protein
MVLRRARSITSGIGWALKIETSLGPEMAANEASAILAPKSREQRNFQHYLRLHHDASSESFLSFLSKS